MRQVAYVVYLAAAFVFVAGLFVQVFLAGLGVFDDPSMFVTHRGFGYLVGSIPIVILVAGALARVGRRPLALAALTLFQGFLQSVFVGLRTDYPVIAALHPVNGFLMLLIAILIARDAWIERPGRTVPEKAG
jgi:hypothetical protein